MNNKKNIRNFSIIAHIDHGKSTLADRIIEMCKGVEQREMKAQLLDSMELERERGITIKLNAVTLEYTRNEETYVFNLIDTPGHVDFTYEVSRSLAASDGAILLVDSTQGVQPQTIANTYLAIENDLKILPVLNKVDMEASDVEKTKLDIIETLGIDASDAPEISAKTGYGVTDVLDMIIDEFPAPKDADDESDLRALLFDSAFDPYRGIVSFVKVESGKIRKGDTLKFVQNGVEFDVVELGITTPIEVKTEELNSGNVGWIVTTVRDIKSTFIGDTLTHKNKKVKPLPGYRPLKPMVFSGFYPIDTSQFTQLQEALEKISLSDSSLEYEKETSQALGFGYRVGFLGLLHMEIIQERIDREFNIPIISTAPSVVYQITHRNTNKVEHIQNPSQFPDRGIIETIEEPFVKLSLFSPQEYVGKLMEYIHERRGEYVTLETVSDKMNTLIYEMPLAEIVFDFFNAVKSISKGYASFDYEIIGYRKSELVKMDILVHGEQVDALSLIVPKDRAYYIGKEVIQKLKTLIPRHNFEIPLQAAIGGKILSRETIKAYRKDVTAKLYGGDISRKKKLLQKQKKGKKKAKMLGSVEVPQEAFVAVLKND